MFEQLLEVVRPGTDLYKSTNQCYIDLKNQVRTCASMTPSEYFKQVKKNIPALRHYQEQPGDMKPLTKQRGDEQDELAATKILTQKISNKKQNVMVVRP